MTQEQAISEIRTKSSVPLWPTLGTAIGYSRCGTYSLAREGKIEGLSETERTRRRGSLSHQGDQCVKVILLIPFEEDHHGVRSPYSIEEDQISHTDTLAPWSDPLRRLRRSRAQMEIGTRGLPRFAQDKPPEKCVSRITPLVTIGLDADVGHHGVGYISPYRFLPTLRPSINGYHAAAMPDRSPPEQRRGF